jgi:hypothetical protein
MHEVWAKQQPNSRSGGPVFAAVLFNRADRGEASINLPFSAFGAIAGAGTNATAHVRDILAHEDLGEFSGSFTTIKPIPAHGCAFVTLTFNEQFTAPAIKTEDNLAAAAASPYGNVRQQPAVVRLHVHPAGDDANAGSEDSPLRTPAAARDLLRQAPAGAVTKEVVLHAGTYPPLQLGAADSGTPGNPVRWTGLAGSVLSGGVPLPPAVWKPRSAGDKVMVANLSVISGVPDDLGSIEHGSGVRGCLNDRAELSLGPYKMIVARYPNLRVSAGLIDWRLTWMRANGNFNTHGAGAYCNGEDPKNVTGCLLLPAKPSALQAAAPQGMAAARQGPCANVSGDWTDPYHYGEKLHIAQAGCALVATNTLASGWKTAQGTISGNDLTAHFGVSACLARQKSCMDVHGPYNLSYYNVMYM